MIDSHYVKDIHLTSCIVLDCVLTAGDLCR